MINQNWIFGRHCGLSFATTPPSVIFSPFPAIDTYEGCASISDSSGNLLLYTDGLNVWDSSGTVRYTGLLGDPSSTQSAIIVPDPANDRQYYIFTTDGSSAPSPWNHFNGIRINIDTWAVTQLSSLMTMPVTSDYSPTEKLTAVQHKNCKDFWVITIIQKGNVEVGSGTGSFRVFKVDSSGVSHVGDTPMNINVFDGGYLKVSQNGKRLAVANGLGRNILLYSFDNSSGIIDITSLITILPPEPAVIYGIEFSPNSNLLYYSTLTQLTAPAYIFQVDLTLPIASVLVGTHTNPEGNGRYVIGALQLGMDGVIYIAKDAESSLGGILNPDVPGTGCNVNMSYIPNLANGICLMGLPNLIPNPCPCPCENENCEEETKEANKILDSQCDHKTFTIIANGQTFPVPCMPAFPVVNLKPIFTLHWGDGPSDKLESHDTEIIFFRIHNPFNNIIFKGVKIFNITITPNQTLPDGENALLIIPSEIVCFDEVQPCSHVSRDFAFFIQNCIPGPYQISFDYCIEEITIVGNNEEKVSFNINVVAS
jgi:hypothetical protein